MPVVLLTLVATPLLIGGATLVARRWGPAMGGLLVALPLTSGPVAFFLALEHGTTFGADTAVGSLAGAAAEAAFCVAYALAGRRSGWPIGLAAGTLAFAAAGLALGAVPALALWPVLAIDLAALGGALLIVPVDPASAGPVATPRWDLALRVVVGTAIVVGLTALAPALGPRASGLAATFPVLAAVLAAFTQQGEGPARAISVLRGLVVGLFAFAAFFTVVGGTIEALGIGPSFLAATAAALVVQAGGIWLVQRATATAPAHVSGDEA